MTTDEIAIKLQESIAATLRKFMNAPFTPITEEQIRSQCAALVAEAAPPHSKFWVPVVADGGVADGRVQVDLVPPGSGLFGCTCDAYANGEGRGVGGDWVLYGWAASIACPLHGQVLRDERARDAGNGAAEVTITDVDTGKSRIVEPGEHVEITRLAITESGGVLLGSSDGHCALVEDVSAPAPPEWHAPDSLSAGDALAMVAAAFPTTEPKIAYDGDGAWVRVKTGLAELSFWPQMRGPGWAWSVDAHSEYESADVAALAEAIAGCKTKIREMVRELLTEGEI